MKLLKLIGFKNGGNTCNNCIYFQNDPAKIEEIYPGLNIMSSGYASVRDKDGLCCYYNVYLSAGDGCANFTNTIINAAGKTRL